LLLARPFLAWSVSNRVRRSSVTACSKTYIMHPVSNHETVQRRVCFGGGVYHRAGRTMVKPDSHFTSKVFPPIVLPLLKRHAHVNHLAFNKCDFSAPGFWLCNNGSFMTHARIISYAWDCPVDTRSFEGDLAFPSIPIHPRVNSIRPCT
jgi:hypothetical protein